MLSRRLTFPEIVGSQCEIDRIKQGFSCLMRDTLVSRSGYGFGASFVCEHVAKIGTVDHPDALGICWTDGLIALNLKKPQMDDPWFLASVVLHEAVHQDWAKRHGTTRNSAKEELDCLMEQLRFLERNGQDASFVNYQIKLLELA